MSQTQETSTRSTRPEAPNSSTISVVLQIYSNPLSRSNNPSILHNSSSTFIKETSILKVSYILLNGQSSKTKITSSESSKEEMMNENGYSMVAKIIPGLSEDKQRVFSLESPAINHLPNTINDFKDEEIFRNTYLSLKSSQHSEYTLQHGDILKFAKETYRFRKINQIDHHFTPIDSLKWNQKVYKQEILIFGCCKICLSSEMSHDSDYIVSPCSCTGSCGFVHLDCLRQWICNKIESRKKGLVRTYNLKKFDCQICKTMFPKYAMIMGTFQELIPIDLWKDSQYVLEQISNENNHMIHCISKKAEEDLVVKVGRNTENDITLEDMSVSRFHACLVFEEERVILKDLNSKFGTFLLFARTLHQKKSISLMSSKWTFNLKVGKENQTECENEDD